MARSAARKLLKELPTAEEMAEAISRLRLMDDAGVALMGAAYLDHALEFESTLHCHSHKTRRKAVVRWGAKRGSWNLFSKNKNGLRPGFIVE